MKAVRVNDFGGPEVLSVEELEVPSPADHEVLVKIEAAGLNYIDTYQRSGLYQIPLPTTLGMEGAGSVVAAGPDVKSLKPGDRVAFTNVMGAYADYIKASEDRLVPIPDGVSFDEGAAAMLQGCTAHYLSQTTYKLGKRDRCLIHAAAGGVGLLLIQMAKNAGAFVIGTCSTEAKAELATAAGADEVVLYSKQDFKTEVKRITGGEGVTVAYDSVGKATFEDSIDSLSKRGYMVLYGNASGPVTEFNPASLAAKGSLFLTRPALFDYIADRAELIQRSSDVFNWIREGRLRLRMEHFFPLTEARASHEALEGRRTTGKVLLKPEGT